MNKLRKEIIKQHSGNINSKIPLLKSDHYKILPYTLDGDAPKQYIKAYFYYENCPRKANPKSWDGYYAKFGHKSYPHESIVEYAINQIGAAIGLKMNETRLVIANEQVRFLSKDFITKGKRLIHGTEILAEYFEDNDFIDQINEDKKERRKLLTFEVVEDAIRHVYEEHAQEIITRLVELITFDAIIGNNDRHFYNWGVIGDIRKEQDGPVHFSPIYDSARGLLWNSTDVEIFKMYHQSRTDDRIIQSYCAKSKPRFSFQENHNANHFELIRYLANRNQNYRQTILNLISDKKEHLSLLKLSETVTALFIPERLTLMREILTYRFQHLREIV